MEMAIFPWHRPAMIRARPFAAIILAAGKGTRMKSDVHKVLHPIAGRAMLDHLMGVLEGLGPARKVVVVGAGRDQVESLVDARGGEIVVQEKQLGTAHAVLQAEPKLADFDGDVLILYGDTPLVEAETMSRMLERLHAEDRPAVVVVGFRPTDPGAYGRILARADGTIDKMVEFKDATEAERAVDLCNSGMLAAASGELFALLGRVGCDNAAGEYYLPDIVMLAAVGGDRGRAVGDGRRQQPRRARFGRGRMAAPPPAQGDG
jgi:bifunctional UDP-N-acetylglucosamine pyrophosphorylase / glucosamine-1-phosphate N-acetyltransferase